MVRKKREGPRDGKKKGDKAERPSGGEEDDFETRLNLRLKEKEANLAQVRGGVALEGAWLACYVLGPSGKGGEGMGGSQRRLPFMASGEGGRRLPFMADGWEIARSFAWHLPFMAGDG